MHQLNVQLMNVLSVQLLTVRRQIVLVQIAQAQTVAQVVQVRVQVQHQNVVLATNSRCALPNC